MRRRFILALILAVLPFAFLAAGQAVWRLVRAEADAREDLIDAARASSAQEANIVGRAESVLLALGNLPDIREAGESCAKIVAAALIGSPYTGISRLDAQGKVLCSSSPGSVGEDFSQADWWLKLQGRNDFIISNQHLGAVSNRPLLTAAIPLAGDSGQRIGALVLGIPTDFLSQSVRDRHLATDTVAALIDGSGAIIASSDDSAASIFAAGLPASGNELRQSIDSAGETWRYAVAPVHEKDLYIAFARRRNALLGWNYLDFAANIALPIMMAVFAFIATWYAADRFVLRWIAYLQRVARAYGGGHFALRPSAEDAPAEIQQLAGAMGDMAENIRARDASLRLALEQRTVISREIHHRVKNNLQIVASLLQIESRRLAEPAAREALRVTHTRINAIALVHRILEEIDDRTVVSLKALFQDLARMLSDAFSGDYHREPVTVEVPDELVETDAAVPLALYMVEQASDVYGRAAAAKRADIGFMVRLSKADKFFKLALSCNGEDCVDEGLRGPNFVAAYARQLEGRLSRVCEGGRTNLILDFPDRWSVTRPTAPA